MITNFYFFGIQMLGNNSKFKPVLMARVLDYSKNEKVWTIWIPSLLFNADPLFINIPIAPDDNTVGIRNTDKSGF